MVLLKVYYCSISEPERVKAATIKHYYVEMQLFRKLLTDDTDNRYKPHKNSLHRGRKPLTVTVHLLDLVGYNKHWYFAKRKRQFR